VRALCGRRSLKCDEYEMHYVCFCFVFIMYILCVISKLLTQQLGGEERVAIHNKFCTPFVDQAGLSRS